MGIRMHLSAGYGLDLAAHPVLRRERLDYDILEDEALFAEWKTSVLDFAVREKETMERLIFHESMNPPSCLADMVVYDDEGGDPNRLVLVPALSRKKWTRYDDHLDVFLLEAQKGDDLLNDGMPVEWLPRPGTLYPYIHLMRASSASPLGIQKYWVNCYRDHPMHKDDIAWAPWHLWFLLRTIFTLTDAETTEVFLALRPGIYRHWG